MVKEKRILSYFIGWLIIGFCIMFIGVINVDAATYYTDYGYAQQYYDNNGSTITAVTTTWNESLQSYVSNNITTVANSYGAGLSITSPIPIINNHTYTISIYFEGKNNIALSSKPSLSLGNSLTSASYNYSISNYWADTIQNTISNNRVLQYVFKAKGNANFLFIPWTTTSTVSQTYVLTSINMEDLGSEGISQEDINNSLNNQTNIINDSIQNSTDTITGAIGDTENNINNNIQSSQDNINNNIQSSQDNINNNIDNMEDAIIDSNEETQEVIKDQFNNCTDSYSITNFEVGSLVGTTGVENVSSVRLRTKNFILVNPSTNYILSLSSDFNINVFVFEYDNNYKFIRRIPGNWTNVPYSFETTNNTKYIKIIFSKDTNEQMNINDISNVLLDGKICSNKIDETNDKLDNLQGAITDDSSPNIDGLADSAGWLPPGPLDSVLNLPLSLFNSLTTNLNKSCSPISIPLPYVNKNLTIPCINTLYNKIGVSTFINWLGVIVSGLMLYTYLLKLYKWIEDRISLNETHSVDNWGGL